MSVSRNRLEPLQQHARLVADGRGLAVTAGGKLDGAHHPAGLQGQQHLEVRGELPRRLPHRPGGVHGKLRVAGLKPGHRAHPGLPAAQGGGHVAHQRVDVLTQREAGAEGRMAIWPRRGASPTSPCSRT